MLDNIFSNASIGALIGAGVGMLVLPLAYFLILVLDKKSEMIVKTNFVVNMIFMTGFLFFGALIALPYALDQLISINTQHVFAGSFFILTMLCGFCLYDALQRKIEWKEEGVFLQRWNASPQYYSWSQIIAIEWDPIWDIWRIHLNDGKQFAFHPMMTGAMRFLEVAIDKAGLFTEGKYSHLLR